MITKKLWIAEKPDAGKTIAAYLAKTSGVPAQAFKTHVIVGNDVVAWLQGHVLEMVPPHEYNPRYKTWSAADLPIFPVEFRLEPIDRTKHLLANIGSQLKICTEVVLCTDADAQGELIGRQCLNHFHNKKPVTRMWASGLNDAGLQKAIANIKPLSDYDGHYHSARAQSHADWLYGINMSRACGIAARKRGADFVISVGRVQTPTLHIVVDRELAIRTFTPVDYFTPWIETDTVPGFRAKWLPEEDDDRLDIEGRLLDKNEASKIAARCQAAGKATVIEQDIEKASESAPLPFSLSALQVLASKKYGFGAKQVLDLAQSLYDKKLTSYPRTDCDYLEESMHPEASDILMSLAKAPLPTAFGGAIRGAKPALKSRAFNDKKVTAHYAIVPLLLDSPADIASLNDMEKKVYLEVVKRYVLQFWPVAHYQATRVVLQCDQDSFIVRGKRYTDEGWRKAFTIEKDAEDGDDADEADQKMPPLSMGQVIGVPLSGFDAATTKPPKRFTEGTLLQAMKNCHHWVLDKAIKEKLKDRAGLGTEATRANIIDLLINGRKFIDRDGKYLVPSAAGEQLSLSLPASMTAPDMTALWGTFTDAILQGKATYETFIDNQRKWLVDMVRSADTFFAKAVFAGGNGAGFEKGSRASGVSKAQTEIVASDFQCSCQGALRRINGKYGWFFGCSNQDCKKIYRDVDGEPVEKDAPAPAVAFGTTAHARTSAPAKHVCPKCKTGNLRLIARKDKSGSFWGCSNFITGCKGAFENADGKPQLAGKVAA